ncbi:hypothetical protein C8J57DRAFT_1246128 [Mycena rebaudengoi]|nr:hypothetical protein C8J57DRAFT_1246128 [Mycena rebaudengoi]
MEIVAVDQGLARDDMMGGGEKGNATEMPGRRFCHGVTDEMSVVRSDFLRAVPFPHRCGNGLGQDLAGGLGEIFLWRLRADATETGEDGLKPYAEKQVDLWGRFAEHAQEMFDWAQITSKKDRWRKKGPALTLITVN